MTSTTDSTQSRKNKKAKKKVKEERTISFHELFRYANYWDHFLIFIACLMAFIKSLVFPVAIIVYSELVAMFIDRNLGVGTSSATIALPLFGGGKMLSNATHEENMAELKKDSISFGILITIDTIVLFISGIAYVDLLNHVALKLIVRMRRKFFEATIRQDIGWHDVTKNQNFAVRITDNMEKIRNGISENIGHFIQLFCDIVISIIISFIYGWKLTLSICIYIPLTVLVNYVVAKYQSKLTTREQDSYAIASSIVEEVIGAIRTVVAFGGEKVEAQRYEQRLVPARKAGQLKGAWSGLSDSILKAMLFIASAASFWYGAHLILDDREKNAEDKDYTPAVLMIVISGIIVGADHISRTTPFLETFAMARGSAVAIFEVMDSTPKIDPMSKDGKILNYGLKGNIEFQDVFFRYPSREDAIVLRGFNLSIKEGETVALVGYSGSGKSTCVQLLQRFYDPIFGKILLDNEDIKKYNVSWLRSNMAVVGQEPVLFQGTIGENIRHGKPDATQKEVEDASRAANAHDFIIGLPDSYNTIISEKGVQLSGGQRQRIAIARALIQKPKILLLDEATSALDYHSEKLVQSALDRASKGRTTIVVSHRLSAICHADRIIFISDGKILEQGTHDELMQRAGKYYDMVSAHEYTGNAEDTITDMESEINLELMKDRKLSEDLVKQKNSMLDPRFSESSIDKNVIKYFSNKKAKNDENLTEKEETTNFTKTFFRILLSTKPEWSFLALGTICAGLYGCAQPAFSLVLAELYASLAEPDPEDVLKHTSTMSIISVVVGLSACVVCFTQTYFFNLAGVWLTTRMRSETFRSFMRQDMAWFDEKENSVGALSARLSGDASSVQGAIGFPLSNIIQALTNFICSFSIAFAYSWELALICLCTAPFMVAAIVFEAKFANKSALKEKVVLEETSRIATETIAQIRTVAALRREPGVIAEYDKEIDRYEMQIKRRLRFRGLVNSLGMAIMFFGYAVTLTYGGIMNAEGKIKFEDIMKIANTMLYGLFILAQSLAFTPAFNAALISASRLYQIIDREPSIQSPDIFGAKSNGVVISKTNVVQQGVSYRDINFSYPTRPDQKVLKNFNLDVLQGKTIALVGSSGSGKSTCVQLLQRFYDPISGKILIDQEDIHQDMELPTLRRRLGIVSQEPSLFEKTIAENIGYGDTTRVVPMTQIIAAAKMANAHDFITALPSGYDTCLGSKGTQLSGGQKQRIAIARALVRNPKILLLDEATSALDLQSERVVQTALDEACAGRTCIVIAHRLATVQNADLICVIQSGRIVEHGNHPQLIAKNGIYAKLYRSQPNTQ
ncbi:multidrug resistance protein homolog 65-like [Teleopsis dalmanni]|uniref:multidrug resistance protein homolog 65-like n=1 Tax=Teleopsis dalmanni TaxID=139649 RepID=UPI0018CDEECD|nr:multidrug resistance protein homolog 65-like [Teleopsis dalmanni]